MLERAAYERVCVPESMLGSAGVKAGEWYAGKDDFAYLLPRFEALTVICMLCFLSH